MPDTGLLVRAVSSFYYVDVGETVLCCRARGRLRLDGTDPLPGDRVRLQGQVVTGVEPRVNAFVRPGVANVDRIVFVASGARPETDPYLIDKMSVVARSAGAAFLLCLNKTDLKPADALYADYRRAGVPVLRTSAATGEGIPELSELLRDGISVLTGNSGVGKSSLLNLLIPGLNAVTAEISPKHGRGRHTTRHTELCRLPGGGWCADSPGFAVLDLNLLLPVKPEALADCFPEFPAGVCRFPDCRHGKEPDCAVRAAVEAGEIPEGRYRSYIRMLRELQHPERSR